MSSSYNGSVAMSRKLTAEETKELRLTLLPYFHARGGGTDDLEVENISDFIDYMLTMISNMKDVDNVIQDLLDMQMDFFTQEMSEKIGEAMSNFIQTVEGGGDEQEEDGDTEATEESTKDKGNALTMSGALGASREGGRAKNNNTKNRIDERNDRRDIDNRESKGRGRGDRGGRAGGRQGDRSGRGGGRHHGGREGGRHGNQNDRRRDDRGGRSIQREAFDRLARGDKSGGGSNGRRDDRRDRDGPPGRGGGRTRGGRDSGRGDQMSGNRRGRNEYEDEEFMFPDGGRGRGRGRGGRGGRGRSAPDVPQKRARYDGDYHDEGHYDDGNGYDDGYGYGGGAYSFPPQRGGGRGRGFTSRGRGRGRGERADHGETQPKNGDDEKRGFYGDNADAESGEQGDAGNHPSPMVQASYSGGRGGYGYSFGGRFGGRGRGRGRTFPGRAHVVNLIQSKTWVRKKEDDNGEGQSAGDAEG